MEGCINPTGWYERTIDGKQHRFPACIAGDAEKVDIWHEAVLQAREELKG